MKISIVTPCFNSEKTLRDTIESVLSQTYSNIEYIIVDNNSTDKTVEIAKEYGDKIKIVPEAVKGIYPAMNAGIKNATGDIVGIINSDDYYLNNKVFEKVVNEFEKSGADAVYGDLVFIKEDKNKAVRFWKSSKFSEWKLNFGWMPPHPTFFVKNEIYKKYGLFDQSFKIAGDYELIVRLLKKIKIKVSYIPETLSVMRVGGLSSKNLKNRIFIVKESREAWRKNGFKVPFFFIFRQIIKIPQYFRKFKIN